MSCYSRREFLAAGGGSLLAAACGERLFAAPSDAAPQPPAGNDYLGSARTYRVQHRVSVDMGTLPFLLLEIWLPLPLVDQTICPEQSAQSLTLTPRARISREADKLARVANRSFAGRGAGRARRVYSLEAGYEVTLRGQPFDVELHSKYSGSRAKQDVEYRKDAQYKLFTRSEKKVPAGHESIEAMALRIKRENVSPYDTARAFYDWIVDNVEYKKGRTFGGALFCLQERQGECGDFSALFVALCRAAKIPARPVVGFWADKHNGWHCWAQFMLPCGRWLPVDCQMGSHGFFARRLHFGQTDNRRVALCKTFDVTLVNPHGKNRHTDFLQNGRWWWQTNQTLQKSLRPTFSFEVRGEVV